MGWLAITIWTIIGLWVLIGIIQMARNWSNTKALMDMALHTGRKEGVSIRENIDGVIKKKK